MNASMNSAQEMSLHALWDSLFCLRDSQVFVCVRVSLLLPTSRWITDMHVHAQMQAMVPITVFYRLSSLITLQELGDALHCSLNASLQGCSERAVQFPGWKLNLLGDQNRLRFLVPFCSFLWAYFSCSLQVCYLLIPHQI